MRQRAGWMTSSDDTILELLEESGLALNKKAMHVNFKARGISISYNTIKRRIPKLADAGLVEELDDEPSYCRITDEGLAYLDGDHQPSDELG